MYMRLLYLNLQPEGISLARTYYDSAVLPRLRTVPGCLFARLIQNHTKKSEMISMTLWKKKEDAEFYHNSPVFEQLMIEFKPFLAESSVWKIQLSEKMELEYKPEIEEPVIQALPVSTLANFKTIKPCDSSPIFVRIVSHRLQKGKLDEFRNLYQHHIVPALEKTPGCCYAYLMENLQNGEEIVSVTIWDSRLAAEEYEKSGKFDSLVDRVKHTFSELFQWKMSLASDSDRQAKTSDDMKVDHYQVVNKQELK
jgi:quinol monooxygenase YgiN